MHSPVRRCYLHVGLPKTGTSYVQSIIWSSREALEAQGVQLPMHKRADHFQVALALRGLLDETMDSAHAFAALDRLADAVPQLTAPAVLISHEFLAAATKEQADRLVGMFPGFEVHVVITARDLARQVPSAWQQRIKERELHRFEEFVDAVAARAPLADDFWANQDLADVADRWGGAVPPERVHIVTVPRAGGELAQLHERFFSVLGVDPDRLPATAPARNSALGLVQAETLRRVSLALGDRLPHPRAGFGRVGKDYLAKKVLSPQGGAPPRLPDRLVEWSRQVCQEWVQALQSRGYDVVGDPADLVPDPPGDARAEQTVSDAEVADAAVRALATVLDHRFDEMQRRQSRRASMRAQADRIRHQSALIADLEQRLAPAHPPGPRLRRLLSRLRRGGRR